jgi:enoyl-CoA hydratase
MSDTVLLERMDAIAVVTLNRPARYNAMNAEMCDAFYEISKELAADNDLRAVVVTGAGKAFCSGADLTLLGELASRGGGDGAHAMLAGFRALYEALGAVDLIHAPTIAAINGACVGGGLGLALRCDLRVVAEDAKIGASFATLGVHAGMGITGLLPRSLGHEAATEMLLTGELIRGARAAELGFSSRCVTTEEVLPVAMELAERIAAAAPLAVRSMKRTLMTMTRRDLAMVMELEAPAQVLLAQTEDAQEGIAARMARRTPKFKGR